MGIENDKHIPGLAVPETRSGGSQERPFFFMSLEVQEAFIKGGERPIRITPSVESPGNYVVTFGEPDTSSQPPEEVIRQLDRLRREWSVQ